MTAIEFNQLFHKFKMDHPEYKAGGFTAEKLAAWQEEYFQKVQADIRREAFTEAANICYNTQERPSHAEDVNYRSGMQWMKAEVEKRIRAARDKLK